MSAYVRVKHEAIGTCYIHNIKTGEKSFQEASLLNPKRRAI